MYNIGLYRCSFALKNLSFWQVICKYFFKINIFNFACLGGFFYFKIRFKKGIHHFAFLENNNFLKDVNTLD